MIVQIVYHDSKIPPVINFEVDFVIKEENLGSWINLLNFAAIWTIFCNGIFNWTCDLGDNRCVADTGASVDDDGNDCYNGARIQHFLSLSYNPSIDKLEFWEIFIFPPVCIIFFHYITVEMITLMSPHPKKDDMRIKTAIAVRIPEMQ